MYARRNQIFDLGSDWRRGRKSESNFNMPEKIKIFYLANARIPTEKAHGIQIMKMCEALAEQSCELELVIPRRINRLKIDGFEYYKVKKEFYLICDDPKCNGARMVAKEGDNLGIESIRTRLELDERLIEKSFSVHGISKILLRNAVPVGFAKENMDDYELTPEYSYELGESGEVKTLEKPWTIKDDEGRDVYSLLAAPVVLSLIKQLAKVL